MYIKNGCLLPIRLLNELSGLSAMVVLLCHLAPTAAWAYDGIICYNISCRENNLKIRDRIKWKPKPNLCQYSNDLCVPCHYKLIG